MLIILVSTNKKVFKIKQIYYLNLLEVKSSVAETNTKVNNTMGYFNTSIYDFSKPLGYLA